VAAPWESIAAPAVCATTLLLIPYLSSRRPDYLEPVYIFSVTYWYLYFGKPVIRIAQGQDFIYGGENVLLACSIAAVGLLCFYVGYYSRVSRHLAALFPLMSHPSDSARVRRCALAFVALGSTALWVYMSSSGGWRQFWSKPHGYGGVAGFSSYISQASELMLVGFYLMYMDSVAAKKNWQTFLLSALVAVPGVLVYSVLWSRRTNIIWVSIVIYVVLHLRRARRPTLCSLGILVVFIACSVLLALAVRPHLHLSATTADFQSISFLDSTRNLSQRGDEFDSYLAVISLYPLEIEYDYFGLLLHMPLHPIPRALWPDKPPLFTPSWDTFLFASGIAPGASESILGELYMQWGTGAVLGGMFVCGILWRGFYDYLRRCPRAPFMQLFYAVALGNFASFIAQGSVSAITKWLPFTLPGVVIGYWLCKTPAGECALIRARCLCRPRLAARL